MMTNLPRPDLTIEKLFRFDEQQTIERVKIPLSENDTPTLYLFRCDDLLADGQKLAIDNQHGMVGVYHENSIVNKIDMNALEISALTLLVLSLPLPVYHSMLQNLYTLHTMNEDHAEKSGDAPVVNAIHDLVTTCNEKLRFLGMMIGIIDAEYHLTTVNEIYEIE